VGPAPAEKVGSRPMRPPIAPPLPDTGYKNEYIERMGNS